MSATRRARPTPRSCTPASTRRSGSLEARSGPRGPPAAARVRRHHRHPDRERPAPPSSPGPRSRPPSCPELLGKAHANGYAEAELIGADVLYQHEPHLAAGARGALRIPDESIICPWTTTLAYATEAVDGRRPPPAEHDRAWPSRQLDDGGHALSTTAGVIRARWLINAAGLGSDEVDRMLGHDDFTVTPRRGQLVVFDKLARHLVSAIILPIPTGTTKGVLVAPTIYGNLLVGPTAEDLAGQDRHGHHRRRAAVAGRRGRGDRPGPLRRGGHQHLRRTAGRDRAPRLPDPQ